MSSAYKFRLQKVLEYRESQEEEAKRRLLERKAESLQAESRLRAISDQRKHVLGVQPANVFAHLEMEGRLAKHDFEERLASSALAVLRDEEEAAELAWRERKRSLETMTKLQEKDLAGWTLSETRKEQAALDEWAVLRRFQTQ